MASNNNKSGTLAQETAQAFEQFAADLRSIGKSHSKLASLGVRISERKIGEIVVASSREAGVLCDQFDENGVGPETFMGSPIETVKSQD